jgi:hypothetical protein
MALYRLCKTGVIRSDGAVIPATLQNRDYKAYVDWVNRGGVPDAADTEPLPPTELQTATLTLQRDPVFRALVKVLAAHFGMTPAQLVAEIKAQV